AVEDSFMRELRERCAQAGEGFVHVRFARDEMAGGGFDEGQRAETVIFHLVDPVRVVERLTPGRQGHGCELRKHSYDYLSSSLCTGGYRFRDHRMPFGPTSHTRL